MRRRDYWIAVLVATLAFGLVADHAVAKKKKSKKSRGDAIAAHPSDLSYPDLEFRIPEAGDFRHQLSNGIPVYVVEDRDLPLVNVSVMVRLGSFLEQTDDTLKQGVASMTGTLMRQGGAGEMDGEAFDEAVDFLGTNMGSFTGGTSGGANLNCTTMVLDESLDLFFAMLKSPAFDPERIGLRKDEMLENMKQRNDDAQTITSREWSWLMRGEDHFSSR